ncbi:MAG: glutamate 5-kinase [Erysipelotrichaceae bacterium]
MIQKRNEYMRIVIKIGTSTLAHPSGHLNIKRVEQLCKVIADIKNAGNEIIMVSSGAIGMGVGKLGLKSRPKDMPTKQAAAAVGQCELMYIYDKLFSEYHHNVAQLLITNDNFSEEDRYSNFINTLNRLMELDVIPIINENDTIATEEIAVGDNDTLAAKVASAVSANILILLSDIDGLYTADPHKHKDALIIPEVNELNGEITRLATGSLTPQGTGGMITKLNAARICMEKNCEMVITNGNNPNALYDVIDGKQVGTRFRKK